MRAVNGKVSDVSMARAQSRVFAALSLYLLASALRYALICAEYRLFGAGTVRNHIWLWTALTLCEQLSCVLPVILYMRGRDVRKRLLLRRLGFTRGATCAVYAMVCVFVGAALNCAWSVALTHIPGWEYMNTLPTARTWWQLGLTLIGTAIAPALCDGLMACMVLGATSVCSTHPALLTGVFYALLSGNIGRFPEYILLGSSAAYMARQYRSGYAFMCFTGAYLTLRTAWDELALTGALPVSSYISWTTMNGALANAGGLSSIYMACAAAALAAIYTLLLSIVRRPKRVLPTRVGLPDDTPTQIVFYASIITGICALVSDLLRAL